MTRQQVELNQDDERARTRQQDDDRSRPSLQRQGGIASIQQSAGNQAIKRLSEGDDERQKLAVSQPGDPAEREAERVAERVTGSMAPLLSGQADGAGPGGPADPVPRALDLSRISRQATGASESFTEDAVETRIDRLQRDGHQIPQNVRTRFESALGADFDQVRIHTRDAADRAARSLNARAFTMGNHVVFRRNEYDPSTTAGRRLLAHELSHVVQSGDESDVVHRQTTRSGTTEKSAGGKDDQSDEYAKALVDWLGEQKDGKGAIPLSTSQKYELGNGTFTFDIDGELVLMPELTTNFKGLSIKWEPSGGAEGKSNQTYSLEIGAQKISLNWTYDPDLWTIEVGTGGSYGDDKTGKQGDVYTKVRADVDIAQLLVRKVSGGLLKKVEEKTNGAVEVMIDGIIGFKFRFGEGNDAIELHQNYADLKLGFKIDFWKLVQEMEKTGKVVGEAAGRGIEEGAAEVHGVESQGRGKQKADEQPGGYTPEAGVGPVSASSEPGLSYETGAEFHAKTTYGETDEGAVKPTKAEVSTKGYVTVKIGYFTVDLTLWKAEGKSTGTPTERQTMRDRALASGLIDAMETVSLEGLRGAATYDEMTSLVDTINAAWVTAPNQYIRDAKSQITDPGSEIDWEWRNNYPMLFREVGGTNYFSVYSTVHHILRIARQQDPAVERKAAVISRWPGRHGKEISERHREALLDWRVAVDTAERLTMRISGGTTRSELLDDAVNLKNHVDTILEKYSIATLKYIGKYETLANISGLSPAQIVRELTQLQERNTRRRRSREAGVK